MSQKQRLILTSLSLVEFITSFASLKLFINNYLILNICRLFMKKHQPRSCDCPSPASRQLFMWTSAKPPTPPTLCSSCCTLLASQWRRRVWRASSGSCWSTTTRSDWQTDRQTVVGPHWVVKFDRRAGAAADENKWSHFIADRLFILFNQLDGPD